MKRLRYGTAETSNKRNGRLLSFFSFPGFASRLKPQASSLLLRVLIATVFVVTVGLLTVAQRLERYRVGYELARLEALRQDLAGERETLRGRYESLATPRKALEKLDKQSDDPSPEADTAGPTGQNPRTETEPFKRQNLAQTNIEERVRGLEFETWDAGLTFP